MWRLIRSDQPHVTNAKEYADIARERCPNIHVGFIPNNQIKSLESLLSETWTNVVAVPSGKNSDLTTFCIVHIHKGQQSDDKDSDEDSDQESANGESEQEGDGKDTPGIE